MEDNSEFYAYILKIRKQSERNITWYFKRECKEISNKSSRQKKQETPLEAIHCGISRLHNVTLA